MGAEVDGGIMDRHTSPNISPRAAPNPQALPSDAASPRPAMAAGPRPRGSCNGRRRPATAARSARGRDRRATAPAAKKARTPSTAGTGAGARGDCPMSLRTPPRRWRGTRPRSRSTSPTPRPRSPHGPRRSSRPRRRGPRPARVASRSLFGRPTAMSICREGHARPSRTVPGRSGRRAGSPPAYRGGFTSRGRSARPGRRRRRPAPRIGAWTSTVLAACRATASTSFVRPRVVWK